jgi:hypothetical protein
MGKEDRFIASITALDGAPKFLHSSFRLPETTVSSVTGKKLTAASLLLDSGDASNKAEAKNKAFNKSYEASINKKAKTDRISGPEANSIEAKKLNRQGAFELNKEKISDWDSTIQSRRLAKSYDFTNHVSAQPLETFEDSCKKFKIETPLEAEVAKLLHGSVTTSSTNEEKGQFFKDHSKDLKVN